WDVRAELWSRAMSMLQDFSFTGVGLGMYGKVANVLYPFFLIPPDAEMGHAHNHFLQVAVDLGIPGLVIYTTLLGYAIRSYWVNPLRMEDFPAAGDHQPLTRGLL